MNNWQSHTIYYQVGNIGSEVGRAFKWKDIDVKKANGAAERALKLLDWSMADRKNRKYLKELSRVREVFADSFFGDNQYSQNMQSWDNYFLPYALAANAH